MCVSGLFLVLFVYAAFCLFRVGVFLGRGEGGGGVAASVCLFLLLLGLLGVFLVGGVCGLFCFVFVFFFFCVVCFRGFCLGGGGGGRLVFNVCERLYHSSCLCQQLLEDPARKSEREREGGGGERKRERGRRKSSSFRKLFNPSDLQQRFVFPQN